MRDILQDITHTIGGYEVKDVRLSYSNRHKGYYSGRIKLPTNNPNLWDGFIGLLWDSKGRAFIMGKSNPSKRNQDRNFDIKIL